MSDEIMNAQPGQTGDLTGNAVQPNATGFQQVSSALQNQSPDVSWEEREKQLLAKAFQQAQSLVSKSENRQASNFQGMIDQFKAEYGVTLTPEQAQQMAQTQAAKSMQNVSVPAQTQRQTAPAADPAFQGFMYYHGMDANSQLAPVYRQMYQYQNTLGVQLEKSDEEYQKFTHPEKKYANQTEFANAWKQACISKLMRLKSAEAEQQPAEKKGNTNLGQMPLVGSKGSKAKTYDPKRPAKDYVNEYMRNIEL